MPPGYPVLGPAMAPGYPVVSINKYCPLVNRAGEGSTCCLNLNLTYNHQGMTVNKLPAPRPNTSGK